MNTSLQSRLAFHLTRTACVLAIAFATAARNTFAAPTPLPQGLDAAVSGGLDFLAAEQNSADGGFGPAGGPRLATTGLSLLAFLAAGNVPDAGKYGSTVRSAIDFLTMQAPPDGYFGKVDNSRMYGQGIVTLALAEAYGVEDSMEGRQKVSDVLTKAVKVILDAQAVKKGEIYIGGWRYEPQSSDSDISLCGWNVLALRACKSAGMAVPREAVQAAVQFVIRCHSAQGGFGYQPGTPALSSTSGVGVLCLYLLGAAIRPEIVDSLKFLQEHPVDDSNIYLYDTIFYTTQAAFQAGEAAFSSIAYSNFKWLIKNQQPDGGWPEPKGQEKGGRSYTTSLAILSLAVPYRLLPIYQR